ncbi:MAG TPA: invasin domain 3-containing protein [Bacteroidota bacterium]|nr:invasin domain 3-containing protein [Bacteroidota bacterium]
MTVNPGAASTTTSLVTALPTSITADGVSTSTITVQLKDASGNNLAGSGGTVVINTTAGGIGATTDHGNGQYTATLTSPTSAGSATVGATLNSTPLTHTATVTFTAGATTKFAVTMSGGTTLLSAAAKTAGTSFNVRVTAEDTNGNTVPTDTGTVTLTSNAYVGSVLAHITTGGFVDGIVITPTVAGSGDRTITAVQGAVSTPNASGNFTVNAGPAASIAMSSGSPQSAAVSTAFAAPLAAIVRDAFSNPVSGASVVFASPSTGASGTFPGPVRTETKTTAATGIATSDALTANSIAGSYTDTASVSGVGTPALFSLTNTPGTPTQLVIHTAPSTPDTAGVIFHTQPVIYVEDASGNVVTTSGASVTAARATGTGALQGTLTVNAVNGIATFANLSYNVAETMTITFTSGTLTAATTGSIVVAPSLPAKVVLIQQPSSATAGVAIAPPITAQIQDAFSNPVTTGGAQITASLTTGTGVLSGTVIQTTAAGTGIATFGNLSINLTGSKNLTFSSGTLTSAVSSGFTINPAAAVKVKFISEPTPTAAGAVITPAVTVQLLDTFGNNATGGSQVTLAILTGTGTLAGTTSQTPNGTGLATFADLRISASGNKTLRATYLALTPDTSVLFAITALAPKQLAFLTPPSAVISGAVITPAVQVQVEDSLGNALTTDGVSVGIALNGTGVLGGTLTELSSSGVATFANLSVNLAGSKTLTASSGSLTSVTSGSFTVSPAAASKLMFSTQPGNGIAGSAFSAQPVVVLQDPSGNTVTGTAQNVTLAIQTNPAGGTLSGTTTVAVNTSTGFATFSGLSIDKAAPGYTLTATGNTVSTAPGSVISSPFIISPAAPNMVRVESLADGTGGVVPAQTVSSGDPITVYSISRDQFGNFISDTVATWSLINRTGGVSPGDLVAAGNGRSATFTGASLGTAQINAAVTGLTAVPSGVLNVANAGPPVKIRVETLANGTGVVLPDTIIPSGARVIVYGIARDAANNFVRNVVTSWSLQSVSGGVVGGDLVPATGSKSATFTGHVIGSAQIRADSTGLTAVISGKVTVIPGSPASVAATAGSGQSALIGTTFAQKLQATVRDSSSNTVGSGVQVTFSSPGTGAGGTFTGGVNTALTNASGIATAPDFTANKVAGTYNDSAKVAGVAAPAIFALTNTAGAAATVAAAAGTTPQHTPVNGFYPVALAALVKDSSGNPVVGVTVRFTAPAVGASGRFSDSQTNTTTAVTAAGTGLATAAALVANGTSGSFNASAQVTGVTSQATYALTNDPGAPSGVTVTRGTPQTTTVGAAFTDTMSVYVTDGVNPVPNLWVTFTAPSSGARAIFSRTGKPVDSVQTDARGIASASSCTADTVAGTFQVIATARNTPGSGIFSLTANPGTVTKFTVQSPGGGVIGGKLATVPFPVLITSVDAYGNASPNFPTYPVSINVTSNAPLAAGGGVLAFGGGVPPATSLTDTVVVANAGASDTLKVVRVGGAERGASNAFKVDNPVPVVSGVSPSNGNRGQSLSVVISGSGFISGTSVPYFGGNISLSSWSVLSATQISVQLTIQSTTADSVYPVSVINGPPGGGSGTLQRAFTVGTLPAPHIASVAPASGNRLQTVGVVVRGSNFYPGVTTLDFGPGIVINTSSVDSANQISASIKIVAAAASGARNVVVTNPASGGTGGGSDTLKSGFTVTNPAPLLTNIVPAAGNRDQTLNVVFTGDNYIGGATSVSFGDTAIGVVSVSVDSVWRLTVQIAIGQGAAIGAHTVTVTNAAPGGGSASLQNAFSIANPVPVLSSVAPASGIQGHTLNVLLRGSNFVRGASTVSFGSGITVNSARVDSMTQLAATITIAPGAVPGQRYALVINPQPGGDTSNGLVFTVLPGASKIHVATTVMFPSYASQSDYHIADYRLVSIPGGDTIPVTRYLAGTAGTAWQMYWDNGQDSAYNVAWAAGSAFSFAPGRAFWLIKMGNFVLSDTVDAATVDTAGRVDVGLHGGWNLIGDPYPDSVQWSAVTAVNPPVLSNLYTWAGNWQQATALQPYAGYIIQVPDSGKSLAIPAPSGGLGKIAAATDASAWSVNIDLHAAGTVERVSTLGVSPLAGGGRNEFDLHRPRLMSNVPATLFNRPEWDSLNPAFGTDIRPTFRHFAAWPFEVRTALRSPVQLAFRGVDGVPAGFSAFLIDVDGARYQDLRREALYQFAPLRNVSRFSIVIGTPDSVEAALRSVLPPEFALDNNYPNPFNPSTTLPVAIPAASEIRLIVYNILGEQTRVIYAGHVEAGRYLYTWDGKSDRGNPVATGIYIVRLSTSTGRSFVRKLALVR